PSTPQKHQDDGEERDEGEKRHDRDHGAQQEISQGPGTPERALQVREIDAGKWIKAVDGSAGGRRGHDGWPQSAWTIAGGWMTSAPRMFTTSVIARRISAAYISTPTCRAPASGKLFARSAASVFAGEKSDTLIWFALPTSIASAIVSPSARPSARRMPPKM